MNPLSDWRRCERGSFTLIGLLVVIVIIGIMFALYFGGGGPAGPGGGSPATTLGGAKQRAEDTVCRNNLNQLRAAIGIAAGTSGQNPRSLDELQAGVSLTCPVGGEPYEYDPATGRVKCVHPGHEGY